MKFWILAVVSAANLILQDVDQCRNLGGTLVRVGSVYACVVNN